MKWIRRVCVDIHLRGRRNGRPSWFRSLALLSLWGDYRRAAKLAEACLELSLKSWSTRTIFVGFILQYSDGIGAAKGSRSIQSFSIDVEKINGIRLWCIDFRSVPPPPKKKRRSPLMLLSTEEIERNSSTRELWPRTSCDPSCPFGFLLLSRTTNYSLFMVHDWRMWWMIASSSIVIVGVKLGWKFHSQTSSSIDAKLDLMWFD